MEPSHLDTHFFFAVLLGALALTLLIFLPYLGVIVLAVTFAILFGPLHRYMLRLFGRHEGVAAFISALVVFLIVFVPLTLVSIKMFSDAATLYTRITREGIAFQTSEGVNRFLEARFGQMVPFSIRIEEYVKQFLGWLLQNVGTLFPGIARLFLMLFLTLFALYYMFKDGAKLRTALLSLIPLPREHKEAIFNKLHMTAHSVIRGSLVVAIAQGVITGIGFFLFGVPNPVFWGTISVVAALIPPVGTALITVPGALYLVLVGKNIPAIGLLIWGILVVGLIDNFLKPQLMKRGVGIHPFLILLSVLGGIGLFGPIGFLLGPLVLSLFFALLDIYPVLIREKN